MVVGWPARRNTERVVLGGGMVVCVVDVVEVVPLLPTDRVHSSHLDHWHHHILLDTVREFSLLWLLFGLKLLGRRFFIGTRIFVS